MGPVAARLETNLLDLDQHAKRAASLAHLSTSYSQTLLEVRVIRPLVVF